MAPLRAHLSHLPETENTARRVSFWYRARCRQEVFYADYFEQVAASTLPSALAWHFPRLSPWTHGQGIGASFMVT